MDSQRYGDVFLLNFVSHNCVAPGSIQSVFVSNRKLYREVQAGSDSCQAVCNQGVSLCFCSRM
jgi:hypothetical protein